ncbi:CwfJ C-terminus 2-domain-containing protein-like protein [Chytriomyces sp. MP71]|nr:CwfJ C-terminus 2-domain-containing protein-like protein [Chytriomyces sp. MP71]
MGTDGKHKEKKTKKEGKSKKHKKDKKEKRDQTKRRREDSSSDSSDGGRWEEAPSVQDVSVHEPTPTPAPVLSPPLPAPAAAVARDDWMAAAASDDGFAVALRTAKRPVDTRASAAEEERMRKETIRRDREINKDFFNPDFAAPVSSAHAAASAPPQPRKENLVVFGDSKSNWRMMRLKRLQEAAEEEARDLNDLAMERWGSLDELHQLIDEREFLDRKSGKLPSKQAQKGSKSSTERFRSDFKKPRVAEDEIVDEFGREISKRASGNSTSRQEDDAPVDQRKIAVRSVSGSGVASLSRIVPIASTGGFVLSRGESKPSNEPILSMDELNKMNARILRNSLMGMNDPELVAKYERERRRFEEAGTTTTKDETIVIPTIDSRGRLQDVGTDAGSKRLPPGNSKRKREDLRASVYMHMFSQACLPQDTQATHDESGQRIKYAGETEHDASINDLLLQEKMGTSASYDLEIANRITKDITYREDLDYMDEKADELAKKTQVSDYAKRQNAIQDFKKANAALEKCLHCTQESTGLPKTTILASGTRVYLCLPTTIEMVPFHCQIVPLAHTLTTLELDDDDWTEIRNFMKCLIQMNWERGHGCIFMEQVVNFRWHKHTVIDCVPVPLGKFEDAPAFFKEALMACEEEWSQHRKVIDTAKSGFRRSMVKNLPYFHVWFEPNKGYGHVIEDSAEWPEWFGREVLGSMMELSPDKWRKLKRAQNGDLEVRKMAFKRAFDKFDWTKALG